MGFEVAKEAARRGHRVDLVTGPVERQAPEASIKTTRVVSADEMFDVCCQTWPACDAVIMTASVADYRPAERARGKPPRHGAARQTLDLVRNPDIVATLAAKKRPDQRLIGFALQVENAESEARRKLVAKGLDAIVLNSPASFGASEAEFTLLTLNGPSQALGKIAKRDLAVHLLDWLEKTTTG